MEQQEQNSDRYLNENPFRILQSIHRICNSTCEIAKGYGGIRLATAFKKKDYCRKCMFNQLKKGMYVPERYGML